MARHLKTAEEAAEELRKAVNAFLETHCENDGQGVSPDGVVELGHIVGLAVRCNPHYPHEVLQLIATAMKDHCEVTLVRDRDYNRINIVAKQGRT